MANEIINNGAAYVVTAVDSNGKPTRVELLVESEHNWVETNRQEPVNGADGYIEYTCSNGCGQIKKEIIKGCLHNWVTTGNNITDTTHEQKCSKCNETRNVEHTFKLTQYNSTQHTATCTDSLCKKAIRQNHSYSTSYTKFDDSNHYKACACGAGTDYRGHSYNTDGYCATCKGTCSHSSYDYSSDGGTWETTQGHYYSCTYCGGEGGFESHGNIWADDRGVEYCGDCGAMVWCLVEGTLITMIDGSKKAIENVKVGDEVLSYDPNTKEQVPTVVVAAYLTGASRKFTTYNFSDGNHLTAYGQHGIYNAAKGFPKNIEDVTRDDRFINADGELVQVAGSRSKLYSGFPKRRYNLITANNLYFANNILCGSRGPTKPQYFINRGISIPSEVWALWKQDIDESNAYEDFLDNTDFYKSIANEYQEMAKAKNIIKVNKKRLANSDYKTIKRSEGLIGDEEWKIETDKRANYRNQINENEEKVKQYKKIVDNKIQEYRKGITPKDIFEASCKRGNENLEIIKTAIAENKFVPRFPAKDVNNHTHVHE